MAQLNHDIQLADSLTPSFIGERVDEGFYELVVEFAPYADAVTQTSDVDEIISNVFNNNH